MVNRYIFSLFLLCGIIYLLYPKNKIPEDQIFSACVEEANKKADGVRPDFTDAYIISTHNPNTWVAVIPFSIHQGAMTVNAGTMLTCRVKRSKDIFNALVF